MPLPETLLTRPAPGATQREHGLYWLALAEADYESHRWEQATASAHIANAFLLDAQNELKGEVVEESTLIELAEAAELAGAAH